MSEGLILGKFHIGKGYIFLMNADSLIRYDDKVRRFEDL